MRRRIPCLLVTWLYLGTFAFGSVFGRVRGVVHDPQHRPVSGGHVTLHAAHSEFVISVETDGEGGFDLPAVPLGEYRVVVRQAGFADFEEAVTLQSGTSAVLHLELRVGTARDSATVTAAGEAAKVDSATPTTLVSRLDIAATPGADRTNSLQMITDFVPGAYVTHDMLHIRGGHQVSWLIDGVQIPNTNIASNVGAQIDPKDIDYVEVQRGSYSADVGDRTYGVFNVVPRTGFERSREGEVVLSLGSFLQLNDQVNLGSHTERFAYYASVNGNRSDYGLSPPTSAVVHDAANGYGGFESLIYNRTPKDQLRTVGQLRKDFFQIPYDPDVNSVDPSRGLRDGQHETDGLVDLTLAHTFGPSAVLQVSPFLHTNRASYEPSAGDDPVATTSDRRSIYSGLQASVTGQIARNTLQAGLYGFGQRDVYKFGAKFKDGSAALPLNRAAATGGVVEEFVSDSVRVLPWLTVIGGLRQTHFAGEFTEDAWSPRVGVAVQVPHLHWVFRGFYGRFYQPPPLLTASGPVKDFANSQNTTFLPLRGERDEEHQFGVEIPLGGWSVDADTFRTRARNFLDHANVGESSLYYPVSVDGGLIRGWELTVRSPQLWRGGQAHLAYSNQIGEQRGALTGGLVCFPVASDGCATDFSYHPLDHDQRNTLSVGYGMALPFRARAAANVAYGSGFHNGAVTAQYTGAYLPAHTSFDLSLLKEFERMTVSVNGLNLLNERRLLDNSLTFGGFHVSDPREIYGEVRYRFRY